MDKDGAAPAHLEAPPGLDPPSTCSQPNCRFRGTRTVNTDAPSVCQGCGLGLTSIPPNAEISSPTLAGKEEVVKSASGPPKSSTDKPTGRNHKDSSLLPKGARRSNVEGSPDLKGGKKKVEDTAAMECDGQDKETIPGSGTTLSANHSGTATSAVTGAPAVGNLGSQDEVGEVATGVGELSLEDSSGKEEQLFQEFIETEAISHSEYAETGKLLGRRTPELVPRSCMKSPEDFAKWLAYLGFDLASKDHWLRLGLVRAECKGHAGVIKNRIAQAQRIFEYGQGMKNIKITSSNWGEMYGKLVEAAGKCLREVELPVPPSNPEYPLAPRFGELSAEGIQFIRECTGHTSRIFTQLSDLIAGCALVPGTEGKEEIGKMAELMNTAEGISRAELVGAVFWAPNGRDLVDLLTNFWQGSCKAESPWVLHLVFPLPGHLGGLKALHVKDLWKSPVLSGNWEGLVQDFSVSYRPYRMICPKGQSPATTWRHIGIATLAVSELASLPSPLRMEKDLGTASKGLGVFADCFGKDLGKVRRSLARCLNKLRYSVSPPERSPGHVKDFPRVRFHISFAPGSISSFDLGGIFRLLRGEDDTMSLLLANDDILEDGRALLAEISHVVAVKEILPLCSDALWLNSGSVLCRTDHLPQTWNEMIERQFENHPEEMVITVKARASAGGKMWASCPTTSAHVRAIAKNKREDDEPFRECEINLHGSHFHGAMDTMRGIMGNLGSIRLGEAPPGSPLSCTNGPSGTWDSSGTSLGTSSCGWRPLTRSGT